MSCKAYDYQTSPLLGRLFLSRFFACSHDFTICSEDFLCLMHIHLFQVSGPSCQVVNLGAGSDTTYFHLLDEQLPFKNYIEIDFHDLVDQKCHSIKKSAKLLEKLQKQGNDG